MKNENQKELAEALAGELNILGVEDVSSLDILDSLAVAGLALTLDDEDKAGIAYVFDITDLSS